MGIIQRTLETLGYIKKGGEEYTLDQLFNMNVWPGAGLPFSGQKEQLQAYVDWVYAAASVIAQEASSIDLVAYANRTGKTNGKIAKQLADHPAKTRSLMRQFVGQKRALEEQESHILLDLLENPNPVQDGESFREMAFLHLIMSGEAFWVKIANVMGRPQQLWPVMPYNMKEKVERREILHWEYRVGSETLILDPSEVVHLKLTDPNNMYRGVGIVKAAARGISTDSSAADWNRNFFKNSARPDMALETDQQLNTDVIERLRDQWSDRYNGTENAHKVAVLENGLKVSKITATQKEMDFLKSREFNRDEILAMFKTSRTMLGIVDGDGRSNMEASEYNQAKRVIRPLMRRFTSVINHSLAPNYDPKLVIGFTDPVPEDKEFLHRERIESINKYRTVNEVREVVGLEPVQGGDVIYQPSGLLPLGTVATAEPPTDDDTAEDTDTQEGKKGLPKSRALYADAEERDHVGEQRATNQNRRADDYRPRVQTAARGFFDTQKETVLAALPEATEKALKRKLGDPLFNMDDEIARLALLFAPILTDEVKEAGQDAMLLVTAGSFDTVDPAIIQFIQNRTTKVSKAVNKETDKQLRAEIAEGVKNKETLEELSARIERVFGYAAGVRAERIARTETIRAETWASEQAWKQSEVVSAKEWYTAHDERTCQFCGPMDGQILDLGNSYWSKGDVQTGADGGSLKLDFDNIDGPPLHVSCRCTLLPVLIQDD